MKTTSWMGWSAAQPSRLTWDEWQELQRRRAFFADLKATTAVLYGQHPGRAPEYEAAATVEQPETADTRVAALEQFCGQLALENAALRAALHIQDRPAVARVPVGSGLS